MSMISAVLVYPALVRIVTMVGSTSSERKLHELDWKKSAKLDPPVKLMAKEKMDMNSLMAGFILLYLASCSSVVSLSDWTSVVSQQHYKEVETRERCRLLEYSSISRLWL